MTKEYYQILGVSETATLEEIKKSYRKLAQQGHPDKGNTKSSAEREKANEKMQGLNKAYEVLSDQTKEKDMMREKPIFLMMLRTILTDKTIMIQKEQN